MRSHGHDRPDRCSFFNQPRSGKTASFKLDKNAIPFSFRLGERGDIDVLERMMLAEDMTRQRRKARKDTLAATYILQGFIDTHGA